MAKPHTYRTPIPPLHKNHGELAFEFLVRWEKANDRVLRFLEKTPLIVRDSEGLLVVATAPDEKTARRWKEAGLSRFRTEA